MVKPKQRRKKKNLDNLLNDMCLRRLIQTNFSISYIIISLCLPPYEYYTLTLTQQHSCGVWHEIYTIVSCWWLGAVETDHNYSFKTPFFYSHWSSLTRMDAYFMSIGGVAPIKSPFRSGCVGSLSISFFFLYFCVSINIISGWRCCTEHKQWLEGKKNISSWWKKKKTKQNIDEAIQLEILIFINFPSNLVFWSPLCPPPNCYYAGQKLNCDFNQCNSGGWWQPSMSTVDFRAWIRVERRGGQHVAFSLSLC